MNKEIVTVTLPIKPSCEGSFLKIYTVFVADIISKASGTKLYVMTNTFNLKDSDKYNYSDDHYIDLLNKFNITGFKDISFYSDNSKEYKDFIINQIKRLLDSGFLRIKNVDIMICSCNKVQIPNDALVSGTAILDKRKTIIKKQADCFICKKCQSVLKKEKKEVLSLNFKEMNNFDIYPLNLKNELKGIYKKYLNNELVISRNINNLIKIKGREFGIDSDFRWSLYLGYIFKKPTQIKLVVGRASMIHATRVKLISEILFPNLKVCLVVHPKVKIKDIKSNLSKKTLVNFIESDKDYRILRAFMALGINWNKPLTVINSTELFFIKKMFHYHYKELKPTKEDCRIKTLPNILDTFNSSKISKTFSLIRSGTILDEDSTYIMDLICKKY